MTLLATFKAMPLKMHYGDTVREYVQVPKLTRHHVDMNKARQHPRFGGFANSDLFPAMLNGGAAVKPGKLIYLDAIPPGVTVDTSKFLAVITLEVTR